MNSARKHLEFMTSGPVCTFFNRPPNPLYKFILDNGRAFAPGPNTFDGPRGKSGLCFENATLEAMGDPSLLYAEGFVMIYGVPIAHAWNVDLDGNMIDPTLAPALADGTMARVGDYYGVVFGTGYLRKATLKNKVYGLLDPANKTITDLIEGRADWKPERGKVSEKLASS